MKLYLLNKHLSRNIEEFHTTNVGLVVKLNKTCKMKINKVHAFVATYADNNTKQNNASIMKKLLKKLEN